MLVKFVGGSDSKDYLVQCGDGSSGFRGGDLRKQHRRHTAGNSYAQSGDKAANEERIQITRGRQRSTHDEK